MEAWLGVIRVDNELQEAILLSYVEAMLEVILGLIQAASVKNPKLFLLLDLSF